MNAAKIILLLTGVSLAAIAVVGAVLFCRDYPKVAVAGIFTFTALLIVALVSDQRKRRKVAASETVLAALSCPVCGEQFGRDSASAALNPPRLSNVKSMIVDDFGYSTVMCPSCGARSLFHRLTSKLIPVKDPNVV